MDKLSRRDVLVATAAGGLITAAATAQAATFGNPDEPPQGAINTQGNPSSATIIGPNNPALSGQFPGALSPPALCLRCLRWVYSCEAIVLTQAINVEIATRVGPRSMLSSRRQAWLRAHRLLLLALAGDRAGLLDGVGAGTLPVTDAFCASSSRFWSPVSSC